MSSAALLSTRATMSLGFPAFFFLMFRNSARQNLLYLSGIPAYAAEILDTSPARWYISLQCIQREPGAPRVHRIYCVCSDWPHNKHTVGLKIPRSLLAHGTWWIVLIPYTPEVWHTECQTRHCHISFFFTSCVKIWHKHIVTLGKDVNEMTKHSPFGCGFGTVLDRCEFSLWQPQDTRRFHLKQVHWTKHIHQYHFFFIVTSLVLCQDSLPISSECEGRGRTRNNNNLEPQNQWPPT